MKRIDTATKAVDLFGAGKHGYKNGNKALGIPATDLNAEWCNNLQEEVANVIEGAGIALDGAQYNQLYLAIQSLIVAGQKSVVINNAVFEASVATGEAVYWDNANSRFDEAVADGTTKQNAVGFANVANSKVYLFGDAILFGGLSAGSRYYLSDVTPGAITTVAPSPNVVPVGIAKSATELFIDIDPQSGNAQASVTGQFYNLKGSAPGTSAVVTYSADEIVTGDGVGNYTSTRAWNSTITMTTAGVGGLDTGVVAASTWYYAYGITKDDGTKALIASLSSTSPTLPDGYTKWARIGAFRTDGTANKYPLSFLQYGSSVQYISAAGSNVTVLPFMVSGVAGNIATPIYVAVSVSSFVPPTAKKIKVVFGGNYSSSAGAMLAPNANYGAIGSITNPSPMSRSAATSEFDCSIGEMILESANIYYASNSGSGTFVQCMGWEDTI